MRTFWKITRYARALRFWLLLLLAAVAWLGCSEARAQDPYANCFTMSINNALCHTKADAWAAANQRIDAFLSNPENADDYKKCIVPANATEMAPILGKAISFSADCVPLAQSGVNFQRSFAVVCPPGAQWNPDTHMCVVPCDINAPPLTGGTIASPNANPNDCAISTCSGGCQYLSHSNPTLKYWVIDHIAYCSVAGWEATGQTCTPGPGDGASPPADTDGDGISDGNDSAPNNPGDSGDEGEDGSTTCGGEGQPPCEEGEPDGSGEGNTSGGGGSCTSPPHSSGDAILAQIAFQAWATRCAVEGNANQGGGNGTDGDGDMSGVESRLDAIKDAMCDGGETPGNVDVPWNEGDGDGYEWSSGLGTGSCPAPIGFTVDLPSGSAPVEFSFQPLCDFADLLYALVVAMGFLSGAYIVAGVRR